MVRPSALLRRSTKCASTVGRPIPTPRNQLTAKKGGDANGSLAQTERPRKVDILQVHRKKWKADLPEEGQSVPLLGTRQKVEVTFK